MSPRELQKRGLRINQDGVSRTAADLLGHQDVTVDRLATIWPELAGMRLDIAEQLEIDGRYAGYGSWKAGLMMVGVGVALVAAINALGG